MIEIIIGISIGAILIGAAAASTVFVLRSNFDTRTTQIASSLASEYLDNIQSLALSDWQKIYSPPGSKGTNSQFYLIASSTTYALVSGATTTIIEGKNFTRYFSIENASRDSCGIGSISTNATTTCSSVGDSGIADDPSTQKISIMVTWEGGRNLNKIQYLTRSQNKVFIQTDWSGGLGQEAFPTSTNNTFINTKFASSTGIDFSTAGSIKISGIGGGSSATGTIDSTYKWAWASNLGWINFKATDGNVIVSNSELTGYAWSENVGWISLNCSNNNFCGTVNYKVINDGSGNLSGWAWNEAIGWISFDSATAGSSYSYQVIINSSTGEFSGWAWNDKISWISFNCSNTNTCGTVDYKVKTDWRP